MATCEVTEIRSGTTFSIDQSEIILDGALAKGISLPHQCRGASCGTCKARVIEGAVDHGWSLGFALSEEERTQGYCLLCQSRALTPTLRLETVSPTPTDREQAIEADAEVLSVVSLTPKVKRVVMALPSGAPTSYPAGCYVEVAIPEVHPNRMYSVASPYNQSDRMLELFVARHPGGRASGFIHDELKAGDIIKIRGPFGECRLPGGVGPVIGLAGGTGLAPVLSIFEEHLSRGGDDQMLLLLSVREVCEVFGLERLVLLERWYENFRYQVLVTDEPSRYTEGAMLAPSWLRSNYSSLAGYRAVISGAPGFVEACVQECVTLGVGKTNIATDSFVPMIPTPSGGSATSPAMVVI
ncbi:2Fe-2S iron-sulfur cluster binding domain-containing protein [Burkholderia sp. S171]|uniref:2Fe-2S iron-sulfur cluster-binding protein n=1 Tax=Burkholderia sp. S171 TaxID=1641860 RepID=UPI00131CF823|nr:2Fe-2S iron-sulfur cluster binding domain-containing protein [Burkholderia sp. S171]